LQIEKNMMTLITAAKFGIYLVMGLSVLAALGAVLFRNIFHAALAFVVTLLGIAALYFALKAEFLAVVQILIYVGAVMTLIIFAIMLTHRISDYAITRDNSLSISAFVVSSALLVLLHQVFFKTSWNLRQENAAPFVRTEDLGKALLGEYVFPFEVISVLLIAALIGAIVVAKRDKE
jgi:NADH-quinone oxidoreductase subunit J